MKLKGQVGKGIYRARKPVGADGKFLKSRVHPVVPKSTFAHYSFNKVHLVVPRHTSTYYL
jgi:hypothetical protein